MPRKGKKKRKNQQNNQPKKKAVKETAPPKQVSAPQEPTPVDPITEQKFTELQAKYDMAIKHGRCLLEEGDVDGAKVNEQQARAHLKASKKLKGVPPIAPGAVRALARDIIAFETNVSADRAKHLHSLTSTADAKLEEIRDVMGFSRFFGYSLFSGDLPAALKMIDQVDPEIFESRAGEFTQLKEDIESTIRRRAQAEADRLHSRINRLMFQDTEAALALVDELKCNYPAFYDIAKLRASVEQHRSVAKTYQRQQAAAEAVHKAVREAEHQDLRARQEREEKQAKAHRAYAKIVGSRQNKIKPSQALRNLRDEHQRDPEALLAMIQLCRGSYTTYEMEIARLESVQDQAKKTWAGYQELEWIEKSTSGEQVIDRLVEACQREHLEWIEERRDYLKRMLDKCFPHRDLIYLKVLELLKKDCPKCFDVAMWLAELVFEQAYSSCCFYYIPQDKGIEEVDLDEAFKQAEDRSHKLCDKKEHAPKREPWNRRGKNEKKRATSK